jgi:hypothetical protein
MPPLELKSEQLRLVRRQIGHKPNPVRWASLRFRFGVEV